MECYWDANGNLSQIIGCKSNKARLHDWDEENRLRFVLGEKYAGYMMPPYYPERLHQALLCRSGTNSNDARRWWL